VGVLFGDFDLDSDGRRLLRGGREVRLGRRAYELLHYLVAQRPRALSKAQLRDRLWPRNASSESALATVVSELRDALGDDPRRPRYVRTVYGFGYAFCGQAAASATSMSGGAARARLLWANRTFLLGEGDNLLGRAEEAPTRIDVATVSRHHARILVSPGGATLEDLGSRNGTFLRGERVVSPRSLRDGDEIGLGRIRLTFRMSDRAGDLSTQNETPS
jgi:DNA-binding winged helix-turn-helix (wHTH) protein